MKSKALTLLKSYGIITLGALVYAIGFAFFYNPNQIAFGGLTGVAQIINFLAPFLPIGTLVIVLNIPLFLLGWKFLGGHLLLSSMWAMFISSVFIDGIDFFFGKYLTLSSDPLLASILGGALLGASLGFVISQGATTGGTDLLARLLKLKIAWLPMGRLLMVIDCVVIAATGIVFQSFYSSLYGLIGLFVSSTVIDKILYGLDEAKVAYIISAKSQEITHALIHDVDRGVTILQGRGGYSGRDTEVLMCAFKQRQIVQIKAVVKAIDPAAFLIVCQAHEILGDGFREYKQNDI